MKVFKKPIPVKVQYLFEPTVVQTLEGPVTAGLGQALMIGPKDDPYPISLESLFSTYNVDEELGIAYKRRILVDARQITEPTEVTVEWSKEKLYGKPGDYLVTYESGKQWIVEKGIFEETYEVVEQ